MAEPRRRMFRPGMQLGQMPAMLPRRPDWSQAMPSQGRTPGRGGFPRERGRRGATTPAAFARGRRGAATIPPGLAGTGRGFTRDSDTGGMKMKPAWARSGWSGVPVIGSLLGLFDWMRNLIFRGEQARVAKRQIIGPFGSKGRLVPAEGPELTPHDMEALTFGTGKFAQHGARQGAARRGTGRRAMQGAGRRADTRQGTQGQRAFAGQRRAKAA